MKNYLKKNSKIKGIIISTEIILILAAVIVLAFVAMMGLGHIVMNQALSKKATIAINEPQAWYYDASPEIEYNNLMTVTFYVTNIGDEPITISSVTVYVEASGGTRCYYSAIDMYKVVNPAETISISVPVNRASCSSSSLSIPQEGIIQVTYQTSSGYTNSIQAPIVISHA